MTAAAKDQHPAVLEIEHLRVEADSAEGAKTLVQDISLTLRRGEVLGLIGESGAGKSTVGLAAMGYARPGCRLGGTIRFLGRDLMALGDRERRRLRGARVAYVAQSAAAAFNPARRLLDQCIEVPVSRAGMTREAARARARALFARLQLPDPDRIGDRYPHQVSGGQLQRVMTAMAMIAEPDLIIFDEPTTALDVTTQVDVLAAIRRAVRETGTAAIYISHDLAVVAQMADRIMVMRYGALVEEGDTAALIASPREAYTRALLSINRVERHVPPDTETPILQAEGLTAAYGSAVVLDKVDISLARGQTVAIVGESGSGKSTLARVVTGLLPPVSGRILWNGAPMAPSYRQRSPDALRRIQMIHQMPDTALNPRHKVREILGRPLKLFSGLKPAAREARLRALLDMIELEPKTYIDRYPRELSGGQKQRLCIARALAADPDVVICDEVTSALDPLVADGILKLLNRLQRELGVALLFITHDIGIVRAIADEIVVMSRGRVVDAGRRDAVLSPPHHPYTEQLLSSAPEMATGWLDEVLARRAPTGGRDRSTDAPRDPGAFDAMRAPTGGIAGI